MTKNRTVNQQNRHAEALCWFLSVLVVAIVIAVCYAPSNMLFWTADSVGMRQQFAHKMMLCIAAAATLLAPMCAQRAILPESWVNQVNKWRHGMSIGATALLAASLYFASYSRVGRDQFLAGLALGLVILAAPKLAKSIFGMRSRLWYALSAVLVLYYTLPGFFSHILAPGYGPVLDEHLLAFYAGAGGLFDNIPARDVLFRYSMVWPPLLSAGQEIFGRFTVGDYARFGQLGSALFLLFFVTFARQWARRPFVLFLVLALTIPWVNTLHFSVLTPTSGPLRFMGFPLALLVMSGLQGCRHRGAALSLGVLGAFCLCLNIETGISIFLGSLLYALLLSGEKSLSEAVARAILYGIGLVGFLGLYYTGLVLLFGPLPVRNILFNIFIFSGFTGLDLGLPLFFSPMPLLIFLYTLYSLFRSAIKWNEETLTQRDRFRFAIAVILLVWGAYYFNRPHTWNLWTYVLLFCSTNAHLLRFRIRQNQKIAFLRTKLSWPAILFALVVLPYVVNLNINEAKEVARNFVPITSSVSNKQYSEVSGIYVSPKYGASILQRISYLQQNADRQTVCISENMFILASVTRWNTLVPFQRITGDAFNPEQQQQFIQSVLDLPQALVCMDPDFVPEDPKAFNRAYAAEVRQRITQAYGAPRSEGGWLVFERSGY
ncbi:MAG: hypothetical protein Q8O35_14135 [Humidesulfovibrio sp.]|uniref:hypothetical protein n=1 Tax=Humidesulfovibrio sp. TaxID=2910988 RepID=UPI002736B8EE|nr:hypothetical protein [Humidesulfovibrio sp.]MDP2849308.1 hypothetical protein [Humidesulfovibrio sp.]